MSAADKLTIRWWQLPSWLGLDAPCVVSTWCLAIAQSTGKRPAALVMAALFLTVWSIYLADRLFDVARCEDWRDVSGRMQFGRRYWWLFAGCLVASSLSLLVILAIGLPRDVVLRGSAVAVGMAIYVTLFVAPLRKRGKLPGKEFGVGLFFALGCFTVLGVSRSSAPLLGGVAVVVAYNCLVIAARDREVDRLTDSGGASHWWPTIDRDLSWLGALLAVGSTLLAIIGQAPAFFAALAAACGLLLLLHRNARRISGDAVRALADFCLLTPWPVILAAWLHQVH